MITYKRYTDNDFSAWEQFIDSAYNSTIFQNFIQSLMLVDKIYPYSDGLSSINYNYYEKNWPQ